MTTGDVGGPVKILLIEDNPGDARLIQEMLAEPGKADYELKNADRLSQGLERLLEGGIDVVVLDLGLPDSQGLETLGKVRAQASAMPIIVLTGLDDEVTAVEAVRQGAQDYLVKGDVDSKLLWRALRYSIERKGAEEALRESEANYRYLVENITDIIYVLDQNGVMTYISPAVESVLGYTPSELIGVSFADFMYQEDLQPAAEGFLSLLSGNSTQGEYRILTKSGEVRWMLTSNRPVFEGEHVIGATGVLTDITERKRVEEELKEGHQKLQKALAEIVNVLASAVEKRDPYTAGHEKRVAQLASAIAAEMGLTSRKVQGIHVAGSLHDIGKINVPIEILTKPGGIDQHERGIIQMHPQVGYDIIKGVDFPWPIAQAVLQHHERLDGSGYPAGISGEAIIIEARVLAVADVVEAMSSRRPYRESLGMDKALEEIRQNRGVLYDSQVSDVCLRLFTEKGFELE